MFCRASSAAIDFASLKGKAIAVVGSADSAFDAAGAAREAGAKSIHLFARRSSLASVLIAFAAIPAPMMAFAGCYIHE
jgi:NADPH-dependent glutamate synthase beta subunit-like oxidoreductase